MARRAFYSFHYVADNWRAGQVRNMGLIEGNAPVSDNDWESITRGGAAWIERWIESQLEGKSCVIVLIGQSTADRKWVKHEIKRGWDLGKGLVGIHVHGLKDRHGQTARRGRNPFEAFTVNSRPLTMFAKAHDPVGGDSNSIYRSISKNLERWVEEAIAARQAVG